MVNSEVEEWKEEDDEWMDNQEKRENKDANVKYTGFKSTLLIHKVNLFFNFYIEIITSLRQFQKFSFFVRLSLYRKIKISKGHFEY